MATCQAISAVCEAVITLLRESPQPEEFIKRHLEFQVYLSNNFFQPMAAGVSLFLYRIYPNGTHRTPTGRLDPNGQRFRTQLPLDLHFLLTAWGKEASLQHAIAGWMMRILEDTPILPASLLNQDIFHPDETVEISLTELTTEEMFRIWEVIVHHAYQISVPYVARNVKLESKLLLSAGEPIQARTFKARKLESR